MIIDRSDESIKSRAVPLYKGAAKKYRRLGTNGPHFDLICASLNACPSPLVQSADFMSIRRAIS